VRTSNLTRYAVFTNYWTEPLIHLSVLNVYFLVYSKVLLFVICVYRDESASASYYYKSEDMRINAVPSWIKLKEIGLGPGHFEARSKQVGAINHSVMGTAFSFSF
jgi:hypothetical protein